jgi:DNA-binding NtrC family response regulator
MATILMVDDDALLLDLYRAVLDDEFHVLTANSTTQAIELLAAGGVDAVGCDYHLSDGSGLDIVAWIATHCPNLLQTTALISGETVPPLYGFNVKCLYKPVPMEELLDLFCSWLSPTEGGAKHAVDSTKH